MKVTELELPGVLLIEPRVFRDQRGAFVESWNASRFSALGMEVEFVQDNVSWSRRGVIRGLHYQHPGGQAKLSSVLRGEVWDIVVDVRRGSPTFARWIGVTLSHENQRQLFVPEGYAHGFAVRSEEAIFTYKCSRYYDPTFEWTLRWDDPDLGIDWGVPNPVISEKDRNGVRLAELPEEALPDMAQLAKTRCS